MTGVAGAEEIKDGWLHHVTHLQSIQRVLPESPASPDVFSAMSHLRFCRAILSRKSDARQSRSAATLTQRATNKHGFQRFG